jgi:hypothetical protein
VTETEKELALHEKYGTVVVAGLGSCQVVEELSRGRLRVREAMPEDPDVPTEEVVPASAVRTVGPWKRPRADAPRPKASAPRQQPAGKRSRRPKAGGSAERWRTLNNFVDFSMRGLRDAELKVWLALFRASRDGVAIVSQRRLAHLCHKSLPHVNKAVRALEDRGLLEVVEQGHSGGANVRGKTSSYRLRALEPDGGC